MCSQPSAFWISIFTAIVTGIVSVVIWETGRYIRSCILNARRYNKFIGHYSAYYKTIPEDDYDKVVPIKTFNLSRRGKQFIIKGTSPVSPGIKGKITLTGDYGNGYYRHDYDAGSQARFGFMEVQLDYPYILVHETIYDRMKVGPKESHRTIACMHPVGYRWVRSKD